MEEQNSTPSKVGTFVSSAVSRILNLIMILVIIALVALVAWFFHQNELLQNDVKNLEEKIESFEKMNLSSGDRDVVMKEEVEEEKIAKNEKELDAEMDTSKMKSEKSLEDSTSNVSGWKTYKNEKYSYSFNYPEGAKISQPNGTEDGSCVYVKYKSGTVVFAPNPEFGCFRTGVGAYNQQSEATLTLTIANKKYNVTMQEFFMSAEDQQIVSDIVPTTDKFLTLSESIKLDDGTKITFESGGEEENLNKEKYLKVRDEMAKIIETYKSL